MCTSCFVHTASSVENICNNFKIPETLSLVHWEKVAESQFRCSLTTTGSCRQQSPVDDITPRKLKSAEDTWLPPGGWGCSYHAWRFEYLFTEARPLLVHFHFLSLSSSSTSPHLQGHILLTFLLSINSQHFFIASWKTIIFFIINFGWVFSVSVYFW